MNFLAMIQARCGSTRLPGKVLKDLQGKTALERVIDRVSKAKLVDEVMVVTSLNIEDLPIVKLVSSLGSRVFAGSSLDVLDRYYQAAKLLEPKYIIRITADCPVFDHQVLDMAIESLKPGTEYLGMLSETFPDGLDLEIIAFSALKTAWKSARLASEREHVTMYIKNNREQFQIQDFICPLGNLHDQRWTIDEPEDYQFIKALYDHFAPQWDFSMEEIFLYLKEHPEIREINRGLVRNEGLLKSLANDRIVEPPQ